MWHSLANIGFNVRFPLDLVKVACYLVSFHL